MFLSLFQLVALHRVIAEDVFAAEPLPPFPASIKDGYAVIGSYVFVALHFRQSSSIRFS